MPQSRRARGIRKNIRPVIRKRNIGGVAQNLAESFIPPTHAVAILNMHATEEGSWTCRNVGYENINATVLEGGAVINGLHWYIDSAKTNHLYVAINGKLIDLDRIAGIPTNIDAAGYSLTGQVDFQSLNQILYSVDGTLNTPRKWDGTTAGNAAGWPINDGVNQYHRPKFIEEHQNRLVFLNLTDAVGSQDFSSHIALSDLDNGESFTFPAAASNHGAILEIGPGDGQSVIGARSIRIPRSNESILVVFQERSTFVVTGASGLSTDADKFQSVRLNGNYGALNNWCIVNFGQDILVLSEYGVTSYTALTSSGDVQTSPVESDLLRKTIGKINLAHKDKAWGAHFPHRREVWFGIPTGSSDKVDTILVYKYAVNSNETPKWSIRNGFNPAHSVLIDRDIWIGTYDGYAGKMFSADTYAGTPIHWRYEYPPDPLGSEKQIKKVKDLDILAKFTREQVFSLSTKWFGGGNNNNKSRTVTMKRKGGGAVFGTGTKFGVGTVFGGNKEQKKTVKVPGNGERLKVTLSGSTDKAAFEFLGFRSMVEYGALSRQHN